jgi:copper chaperone CopZ
MEWVKTRRFAAVKNFNTALLSIEKIKSKVQDSGYYVRFGKSLTIDNL